MGQKALIEIPNTGEKVQKVSVDLTF